MKTHFVLSGPEVTRHAPGSLVASTWCGVLLTKLAEHPFWTEWAGNESAAWSHDSAQVTCTKCVEKLALETEQRLELRSKRERDDSWQAQYMSWPSEPK